MDFNKIKNFIAVVDAGGITQAMPLLHRTQSAISQQIASLENELDVQLFDRVGKKMILTKTGRDIYDAAKSRLNQVEKDIFSLLSNRKNLSGKLKIGWLQDHSTVYAFFEKLSDFNARYPKIQTEITFDTSYNIESALMERELDFGFLINFNKKHLFQRRCVSKATHNLYSSEKYIAQKGIKFKSDLLNSKVTDLIDLSPSLTSIKPWLLKNMTGKNLQLNHFKPKIVAPNYLAIKDILLSGYGVAILPEHLKTEKLIKIFKNQKALTVELDIAFIKGKSLDAHKQVFLDTILD